MIHILMSTYNGEQYIAEQLDSIIAQTETEWKLFIRDDGSSDHTRQIIERYAEQDSRINLLPADGKNLGAMCSFESLLAQCGGADYYSFADQDDVWLADKLASCADMLRKGESKHGKQTPIVVHTDLTVVDNSLKTISSSFWKYSNLRPDLIESDIHYLAIANCLTGCTMMFNNAVRELALPFNKNAYMHDAWIGLVTLMHGGIICPIHKPTMLYRQHGTNALGAVEYHFTLGSWKWKLFLAKRSYRAGRGLVFGNVLSFIYWKTRYFVSLHK